MDIIKYLKKHYPNTKMQQGTRFCNLLDVCKRKKDGKISIFIIPERFWYYPKDDRDFEDCAITCLEHHLQQRCHRNNGREGEGFILMFGKHQGTNVHQAPADYLIWLYDNDKTSGKLDEYIKLNEVVLREQAKRR